MYHDVAAGLIITSAGLYEGDDATVTVYYGLALKDCCKTTEEWSKCGEPCRAAVILSPESGTDTGLADPAT